MKEHFVYVDYIMKVFFLIKIICPCLLKFLQSEKYMEDNLLFTANNVKISKF